MPGLGDDVHLALKLGYGTGVGLGAGEHDLGFHMGVVHAAEIAQGGLERTGFEQEAVVGDPLVVGKAERLMSLGLLGSRMQPFLVKEACRRFFLRRGRG